MLDDVFYSLLIGDTSMYSDKVAIDFQQTSCKLLPCLEILDLRAQTVMSKLDMMLPPFNVYRADLYDIIISPNRGNKNHLLNHTHRA